MAETVAKATSKGRGSKGLRHWRPLGFALRLSPWSPCVPAALRLFIWAPCSSVISLIAVRWYFMGGLSCARLSSVQTDRSGSVGSVGACW